MSKLTKYEKETIINFNQDEATANIYTCDSAWIRKLDKLAQNDTRITIESEDENSKTYNIPKKWVKVHKPRVHTNEKRKELSLRAKANLKKRQ